MSEVSLKRFYFVLFDNRLTLKTLKLAFIGFAFKLFTCNCVGMTNHNCLVQSKFEILSW